MGSGDGTLAGGLITGHTPFVLGSVTKTLTAVAAARLAKSGVVDFDAAVEACLPGFTMASPFAPRSITLRHLLQHRSGLSQWSGHDRRAQQEGEFAHISPSGPAGGRAEYSSLNFIVLGRVLESASKTDYARLLEEEVFGPLGMTDAFVAGPDGLPLATAAGHQSFFGLEIPRREPAPPRYLVPAGFAAASAHDLGRLGGALVGGGAFAGEQVLAASTVEALLGPLESAGDAMAWGRSRKNGRLVFEHAGNSRTSSSRVRLVPQAGYAIAVLANTNSGPFFSATGELMDGVQAILDGGRAPGLWPKERVFKTALLLGTVLSLLSLFRRGRAWNRAGRPTALVRSGRTLRTLALDVGGGGVLLFGIPRSVGVPIHTMTEYFPDLGMALIVSVVAGVIGGVLRAWTPKES
jgi:CubicO group peptidase (beta-lactamase class C family)